MCIILSLLGISGVCSLVSSTLRRQGIYGQILRVHEDIFSVLTFCVCLNNRFFVNNYFFCCCLLIHHLFFILFSLFSDNKKAYLISHTVLNKHSERLKSISSLTICVTVVKLLNLCKLEFSHM